MKGFTLVELLVVIIIVAILAGIAIPIYRNHINNTWLEICTAQEEAAKEALEIYKLKYDEVPATLAKAWNQYGNEALAIVWARKKKEKNYIYLAYISIQKTKYVIANIFSLNRLEAQPSFSSTLADKSILKCPADPDIDEAGHISYCINSEIAGLSTRAYDRFKIEHPRAAIIACGVGKLEGGLQFTTVDSNTTRGETIESPNLHSNYIRHRNRGRNVAPFIDASDDALILTEGREVEDNPMARTGETAEVATNDPVDPATDEPLPPDDEGR